MALSDRALASRGLIPVAPIRQLIEAWNAKHPDLLELGGPMSGHLSNLAKLSHLTGLSKDVIKSAMKADYITFDNADRIVCSLSVYGAYGWWVEPGLREVYEAFDFSALDQKKPCTVAA